MKFTGDAIALMDLNDKNTININKCVKDQRLYYTLEHKWHMKEKSIGIIVMMKCTKIIFQHES